MDSRHRNTLIIVPTIAGINYCLITGVCATVDCKLSNVTN